MMIPEILVACETPDILCRVELAQINIPPCMGTFILSYGKPDWVVTGSYFGWTNDANWKDFPMPNRKHSIWAFDGSGMNTQIRGCCNFMRGVSVMVNPGESLDSIANRIWHELLHANDLPADDMEDWMESRSWFERFLFKLTIEGHRLFWERYYYLHLTKEIDPKLSLGKYLSYLY